MANSKMTVFVMADISKLQSGLKRAEKDLEHAFGRQTMKTSENFAKGIGAIAVGLGALGVASMKMAADFNTTKKSFNVLIGDTNKAKKFLDNLTQFAAQTPFELKGLTEASKKMLAFKFAAEDIIPIMSAVGNASAMLGSGQEGIDGILMALSQMKAKGRAQGEELLQLAERGVNAYKYLAEAMGTDIPSAMKLVSSGAVDSTTAINAIVKGMEKDFKGGMLALSQEVPGILSNMRDSVDSIMRDVGQSLMEGLNVKSNLADIADVMGAFAKSINQSGLQKTLQTLIPPGLTIAIVTLATAITAIAIPALIKLSMIAASAVIAFVPLGGTALAVASVVGVALGAMMIAGENFAKFWNATWEYCITSTRITTSKMLVVICNFASQVFRLIRPVMNFFGMSDLANAWTNDMASNISQTREDMQLLASRIAELAGIRDEALKGISNDFGGSFDNIKKIIADVKKVDTTFNGLTPDTNNEETETKPSTKPEGVNALSASAAKTEMEWEEVKNRIKDKAADMATDIQNRFNSLSLYGVRKELFDLNAANDKNITDMERSYRDLSILFAKASADEQQVMRNEWKRSGIAFEEYEEGRVLFTAQMAKERFLIEAETAQKIKDLNVGRQSWLDDMDKARDDGDLTAAKSLLSSEQAINELRLDNAKTFIDDYYSLWKSAQMDYNDYMKASIMTVNDSFSDFFTDTLSGSASLKTAFADLLKSFVNMVVQMAAEWAASNLTKNIFGGLMNSSFGGSNRNYGLYNGNHSIGTTITGSIGRFATGGVGGGLMIVGEYGPEAIRLNSPSRIFNHRETEKILGGGNGANVYMTVNTPDANSFKKSRSQIASDMRGLMQRAGR